MNILEDYVSDTVARLLKNKGFDCPCDSYYEYFESLVTLFRGFLPVYSDGKKNHNKNTSWTILSRPTHQMALKWLREVYDIDIVCFHERLPNDCYWCRIEKYPYTVHQQEPVYKTYEQGVEAALKYVLEQKDVI